MNSNAPGHSASGGAAFPVSPVEAFRGRIAAVPALEQVWVRGAIHGEPGVGKTSLALTKKTGKKILFANIEDGYLSLAGSGIDKVDLRRYEDFRDLYLFLKEGHHDYDALFVDTFGEAQKFCTAEVVAEKVRARESKNPFQPSQDDYRQANEKMRQWLWDMRSLPMHIFYVTLSRRIVAEGEMTERYTLGVSDGLASSLFAYSDFVAYMAFARAKKPNTEEIVVVRKLYFRPLGDFDAKVREPQGVRIPDVLTIPNREYPTIDKIIGLFRGKIKPNGR